MTRPRKILLMLGTVVLVGAVIAVLNIKAIRQAYYGRQQGSDDAYLAQHVTGYFPLEWEQTSSLVVRQVEYNGADVVEYRWSNIGAQYRQYHGWPDAPAPDWSSPLQIREDTTLAIQDAMNIAVRDHLWERGDIAYKLRDGERIVDGGEDIYEFVLGPNSGRLRLIQVPDVPDLKLFRYKIGIWTEDVRRQLEYLRSPQSHPTSSVATASTASTPH